MARGRRRTAAFRLRFGKRPPAFAASRRRSWYPQLRFPRKAESWRCNAHDRSWSSVNLNRPADNPRIGCEALLPESVAEHHRASGGRCVILLDEEPADD